MPMHSTALLFDMLDTNDNDTIEFSEFKAAMLKTMMYVNNEHLVKAFRYFDKDKSGYITAPELWSVFESFEDLFNIFSSNDYDMIIKQADANQDGKISYEEFVRYMTSDIQNGYVI
jgi:Ca2+-binding EF-hand superfamily protein